jgi:transposase InsO family protein
MNIPFPAIFLHLDIKGMTRFQQVVWRGDGRRSRQQKHPGWEAFHVAVDDHSRMAFTRTLPDQKTHTTIAFLRDAVDFFARHGIVVRALLTDNGNSYRSHLFRQACLEMASNIAALALTRRKPMAKTNASSRPPCANRPTPLLGPTPSKETSASLPGPTTTTTTVLMVAFTPSRPSAAPNPVQPLDHLQVPHRNS